MQSGRGKAQRSAAFCRALSRPWPLAAIYVASAAACCAIAARSRLTDLHVYRLGGDAVLHGGNLYAVGYFRLPFTYPPFAAVVFAAMAGMPWALAAGLLLVAGVAALPAILYCGLRLDPFPSWLQRTDAARLALTAAVLAVWLEPVRSTLSYGQVNLLLAAAILADLVLPDSFRLKGAAIGLAAGIKLTPAIFAVYLLLTKRYRAAAVAAAAFAWTIAIGYALAPGASAHYWDVTFLRSQRVSPVQNDTNQNLLGAIARDTGRVPGPVWLAVVAVVAVVGLWLSARAYRRGNEAAAFGLCAVTGLLVSPMSWTHHWVIALPALLVAGVSAWRIREVRPRAASVRLAGIAVLAVIGWTSVARRVPGSPKVWLHLDAFWLVVSQLYVLAGLATLALTVVAGISHGRHSAARSSAEARSSPDAMSCPDARSSPESRRAPAAVA